MSDVYQRLAKVLDTLPNGFPSTESGVEIRLLKKIFTPEEADLFCDLRLTFETVDQIAKRTGRSLDGLEDRLIGMQERGELFGLDLGGIKFFKMMPWAFGIYEFQLSRMDRELAEMCEEYMKIYGKQFFKDKPQLMQVVPVEREIPNRQEALHYEQVSSIIKDAQSFMVNECICKKEQGLLDKPCDKPLEVCMAFAPITGVFEDTPTGRVISREEAFAILNKAEEAGLVHLTWNVENGHFFICNCCGCCCGVLRSINELGLNASDVINSYYYAEIDPDTCTACGTCMDERCQVGAIEEDGETYRVIREKCIGCGLCITTCPSEAVRLVRKTEEEIEPPPLDENSWYEERGRRRGVDFSEFK
jgi:electron transport complex protein RnfB